LKESSLISRRITSSRGLTVAAPAYWERRGRPSHPADLIDHDCISYSYMPTPGQWEFREPTAGRKIQVKIAPRLTCNSAELETGLAVAGLGVTRLPAFACARELADGLLEPVLEAYERPPLGVYGVYPHRQHLSAKVRAFVDFLVDRFGD
jgi:DNA-binding transcriptional LysR family regulator